MADNKELLCIECLSKTVTEKIKEEHNYEFSFQEGCCTRCETLGMVTNLDKEDEEEDELKPEYLIMKKIYKK